MYTPLFIIAVLLCILSYFMWAIGRGMPFAAYSALLFFSLLISNEIGKNMGWWQTQEQSFADEMVRWRDEANASTAAGGATEQAAKLLLAVLAVDAKDPLHMDSKQTKAVVAAHRALEIAKAADHPPSATKR